MTIEERDREPAPVRSISDTIPDVSPIWRDRFQAALDSLVAKLRGDRLILAAILCGSLSHDEVWRKSDIDLLLVGTEDFKDRRDYILVEDGINIHVNLLSRSRFRTAIEGSLQGSFFHSFFSKSTLIYTTDPTIVDYYENLRRVGDRDRAAQLLQSGVGLIMTLAKAEKWLYVRKDPTYSFKWLMYCLDSLATIEVVRRNEVAGREVIQQAMKHEPALFQSIYIGLIHGPVTEAIVRRALETINDYLDRNERLLFQPVLDFLDEAGGTRTATEINNYFQKSSQTESASLACEWLADRGVIEKVSAPLRLSEKSRVTVDEAAFHYDGSMERP